MPQRSVALYTNEHPEQVANSTFYQVVRYFDASANGEPYVVEVWQGWFGPRGTVGSEMMARRQRSRRVLKPRLIAA